MTFFRGMGSNWDLQVRNGARISGIRKMWAESDSNGSC
jgi:hypothetical protein